MHNNACRPQHASGSFRMTCDSVFCCLTAIVYMSRFTSLNVRGPGQPTERISVMEPIQLGRVQLLIMQVLWAKGRATAREITDAISASEPIAHSTVQTLLRHLEDKGSVTHEAEGRTFVFVPLVQENLFKESATRDLLERVFGGNVASLVAHLLKHEKVSSEEIAEIRKLINRTAKN